MLFGSHGIHFVPPTKHTCPKRRYRLIPLSPSNQTHATVCSGSTGASWEGEGEKERRESAALHSSHGGEQQPEPERERHPEVPQGRRRWLRLDRAVAERRHPPLHLLPPGRPLRPRPLLRRLQPMVSPVSF
jgi:hypothetical protein